MKKRLFLLLLLLCVVVVGAGVLAYPKTPTEDQLTNLLGKAEGVYALGFDNVFEIGKQEVSLRSPAEEVIGYYDEILNYEEVVSEIFTQNGREQLESSGYGSLPRFLKKDGKIYRASNTLNNSMEYLKEISSVKLLERTWNTFTYEAVVTPLYQWLDETEKQDSQTIAFTVRIQDGKLKVEKLDYPGASGDEIGYTQEELDSISWHE